MLQKGDISNDVILFINKLNSIEQKNKAKAIKDFATNLEKTIFKSIKNMKIIIPPGTIIVTGANSGGPVQCTNVQPITIEKTIV